MWPHPQEQLRRRCQEANAVGNERFSQWREMRLEVAVRANPVGLVTAGAPYPVNLDSEFFPGSQVTVGELTLDDIPAQQGKYDPLYRQKLATLIQNSASDVDQSWARSYAVQAGWEAFHAANFEIALRFWVNSLRLQTADDLDWLTRRNFALCLQELGNSDNAAQCYLLAAEGAEREGRGLEAADYFERAALAWETQLPVQGDRRSLGTDTGIHNSTTCFRKAKSLYANAGESENASRCSVLERETERKWSADRKRRLSLSISHYLWLHGESYWYVIRAIAVIIFAFAFGFFIAGYCIDGKQPQTVCFGEALYLSVITMATVGYGDLTPQAGTSRVLAGAEGLLGIMLMAMLFVTIQRRFAGR